MLDVVELVKRSIVGSEHLCYKGRAVRRRAEVGRDSAPDRAHVRAGDDLRRRDGLCGGV